jgi:biotin carboxyl carrier protein
MALVWGVFGSLSEKVAGGGILLKSGGVFEVVSPAEGRVTDVSVGVGDSVSEGQVVAWLAQPELSARLQEAKARLAALRGDYRRTLDFSGNDAALQGRSVAEQQRNLRQSIATDEQALRWLAERAASQEQLVGQGLLTRSTLLQTRQQQEQTQEKVRSARSQLSQLDVQKLTADNERTRQVSASRHEIEVAQLEVERLERDFRRASQIVSPYTGRILEVMTEQGKMAGRRRAGAQPGPDRQLGEEPGGRALRSLGARQEAQGGDGHPDRPLDRAAGGVRDDAGEGHLRLQLSRHPARDVDGAQERQAGAVALGRRRPLRGARRPDRGPHHPQPCAPPPSCRWRRSSAAPARWPWSSPTTAAGCRSKSCASPAASRATAARRATWSRPPASYGLEAKGFKKEPSSPASSGRR